MIVTWDAGRCLVDRPALAELYHVAERTVRNKCTPVGYDRRTGAALYDADTAGDVLEQVKPRPARTAAARRARAAAAR